MLIFSRQVAMPSTRQPVIILNAQQKARPSWLCTNELDTSANHVNYRTTTRSRQFPRLRACHYLPAFSRGADGRFSMLTMRGDEAQDSFRCRAPCR